MTTAKLIHDRAERQRLKYASEDLLEISTDEFLRLRRSSAWLTLIRATVDLMREKDNETFRLTIEKLVKDCDKDLK